MMSYIMPDRDWEREYENELIRREEEQARAEYEDNLGDEKYAEMVACEMAAILAED